MQGPRTRAQRLRFDSSGPVSRNPFTTAPEQKKMTRKKRLDARKVITEKIIEALKAGVAPWVKGWDGGSSDAWPTNGSSGRRYSGVNVLMLMSGHSRATPLTSG